MYVREREFRRCYSGVILAACLPFGPCFTSKLTFWFSCSDLKPLPWTSEKCANRSSPPPSGVMKPKPFASLNHFTVPVAIFLSFPKKTCCVGVVPSRLTERDASLYHSKMTIHNQGGYGLPELSRLGATPRSVTASVSERKLSTRAARAAALAREGNGSKA
jgi:hypothetical protein